jgi:hypothetical protein
VKTWARVYVGLALPDGDRRVFVLALPPEPEGVPLAEALPLALHVENHSPDGFAWGYLGSGPAQLALAILVDYLGDEAEAARLHQDFKERTVARFLVGRGWVLTGAEIEAALLARRTEATE